MARQVDRDRLVAIDEEWDDATPEAMVVRKTMQEDEWAPNATPLQVQVDLATTDEGRAPGAQGDQLPFCSASAVRALSQSARNWVIPLSVSG